jgi:hypothetical protein
MGFLNGLSALGSSTAAFAGAAGLEQQKSDLAKQSMVLADQLATTRESAGRQEAGQIAATAQASQQAFQAGQTQVTEAGATARSAATNTTSLGVAGISAASAANVAGISAAASKYAADTQSKDTYARIAAAEPEQQAIIAQQAQQTAVAAVQAQNATDLRTAHTALAAEQANAQPDPTKIASLKNQVVSLEASAGTEAATTTAAAGMYRTDMEAVQHFNTELVTATAALNNPDMQDTDRAAQKGLVANLQKQLDGATAALKYSSDMVHSRVGNANGQGAPGVAPAPPAGVPPGSQYSPSLKMWRGPTGQAFDATGKPTTAPGQPGAPATGLINSGAP